MHIILYRYKVMQRTKKNYLKEIFRVLRPMMELMKTMPDIDLILGFNCLKNLIFLMKIKNLLVFSVCNIYSSSII